MTIQKDTIKNWRKKLCMSQEYLAKKIDVTPRTVANWEHGKCDPYTFNLMRMGELFGCGVDGIFLPTAVTESVKSGGKDE